MYDTKYSNKTPKKIGEQESKSFAPDGASPEYQQVGSSRKYGNRGRNFGQGFRLAAGSNDNRISARCLTCLLATFVLRHGWSGNYHGSKSYA